MTVGAHRLPAPPLGVLVFIVGVCTLGAEIAAVRLLAPFFGDSTFIWANTIGVTFLGLSIGYWAGGRLADRHPDLQSLRRLVLVAAALLAVVPLVAHPFLKLSVSAFDSLSVGAFLGSLLGVSVLIAVPIVLLGAVTPWSVRLATPRAEDAGRAAGRMFMLSTAGSLLGTFLAALLLVPEIGTQRTFMTLALVLAAVAAAGAGRAAWLAPVAAAALLVLPPGVTKGEADGGRVLYETETPYQYARVVAAPQGERRLELNEGQVFHSVYRPGRPTPGYYYDSALLAPFSVRRSPPRRIAVLGNAAGTLATAYARFFPATVIDGVEIDGELARIGQRWFGLRARPQLRLHTADARPFLRASAGGYDVVYVDAYRQPYIPFYLATREFFHLVRERLAPGGMLVVNVGHPEDSDALEQALTATIRSAFPDVARDPVQKTNTILIASARRPRAEQLRRAAPRLSPDLDPLAVQMAVRLGPGLAGGPVLTDDRAPVEWLIDKSIVQYAAGGGD